MGEYAINGGAKISGGLRIGGAKNAALPILAASVLNKGVVVIHDCPRLSDTRDTLEILTALGCRVETAGTTVTIDASQADNCAVPVELADKMRSSITFLGPLLGRFGCADISRPGGCKLGQRPIDKHIEALKQMGARFTDVNGLMQVDAGAGGLSGAKICFDMQSVGATENVMLAATLADGTTIIQNAACEPEIVDLQNFLNAMGADITGAGASTVVIHGVKRLHDAEHTIIPDRIAAGTYLVAAAITAGEVTLTNVCPDDLRPITSQLAATGCRIVEYDDEVSLTATGVIKPLQFLRTCAHPGFPTDMQSLFVTYLSVANGTSVIVETIFPERFKHTAELVRMGADITVRGDACVVRGVNRLCGATVNGEELRGTAALILAGIAAEGKTIVRGQEFVERGYESIENVLHSLGADVRLV